MRTLDLPTAVEHIRHLSEHRRGQRGGAPFFLSGAGVSYPPIPLAEHIEKQCRERANQRRVCPEPAEATAAQRYSYWFEQAYPQPLQRQEFLQDLIQKSWISHANFRLAHLLSENAISNIVVTVNFDESTARSLALFGTPHAVFDNPETVWRCDPDRQDVQIVHVHGTHYFYDLANLTTEIERRSRSFWTLFSRTACRSWSDTAAGKVTRSCVRSSAASGNLSPTICTGSATSVPTFKISPPG